ncbi:MAG: hypothetical protein WA885_09245 [Phormidesmis sp.]
MKLLALKSEVYRIAKVTTTRQLKAKYAEIKAWDMRYKDSWQQALNWLKQLSQKEPKDLEISGVGSEATFDDWLSNPPDEYKALFAEAEAAFTSIDEKLTRGKQLTKTAKAMAESLNEFAEASLEESQQLAKTAERNRDISKQADLN